MTESNMPIRILIADDHQLVRQGLIALLSVKPGVVVIGEAAAVCWPIKFLDEFQSDIGVERQSSLTDIMNSLH